MCVSSKFVRKYNFFGFNSKYECILMLLLTTLLLQLVVCTNIVFFCNIAEETIFATNENRCIIKYKKSYFWNISYLFFFFKKSLHQKNSLYTRKINGIRRFASLTITPVCSILLIMFSYQHIFLMYRILHVISLLAGYILCFVYDIESSSLFILIVMKLQVTRHFPIQYHIYQIYVISKKFRKK